MAEESYLKCRIYLENDDCLTEIGVYQLPRTGELLWFGDSLHPNPSAYLITEIAHNVRPSLIHFPVYQDVVIYVKPLHPVSDRSLNKSAEERGSKNEQNPQG